MSQLKVPTGIGLNEHFCRRWLSVKLIRKLEELKPDKRPTMIVDVQRSTMLGSDQEFFCICIGRPLMLTPGGLSSVTIGFLIDKTFRKTVKFWNDPAVGRQVISETCERCPLTSAECEERAAEAQVYEREQHIDAQRQELLTLLGREH